MADDSELDYLRALFTAICFESTVNHYSEIKKIDSINDTRRVLIYPPELISVDGKFYTKRYKIQLSEPSEADLMEDFNKIIKEIYLFNSEGTLRSNYDFYFRDDAVGTVGEDIGFIDVGNYVDAANAYCIIVKTEDGHENVLNFYDFNLADNTGFAHRFTVEPIEDTFELWVKTEDATDFFEIFLGEWGGGSVVWLKIQADKLQYQKEGVGWQDITGGGISDDTWYHIRVDFNCVTSLFDIYINNVLKDSNLAFWSTGNNIGYVNFETDNDTNHNVYIDAIGMGWADGDGYEVGDNLTAYTKPSVLTYINIAYGNRAFENGKTKRWYQDIFLDVEWCTS